MQIQDFSDQDSLPEDSFADYPFYGVINRNAKADKASGPAYFFIKHKFLIFTTAILCFLLIVVGLYLFIRPAKTSPIRSKVPAESDNYISYSYDEEGNKSQAYAYDANGCMIQHTDLTSANGIIDTFSYNESNLVTQMTRSSSDGKTLFIMEFEHPITYLKASAYLTDEHIPANYTEIGYTDYDTGEISYSSTHTFDETGAEVEHTTYFSAQEASSLDGEPHTGIFSITREYSYGKSNHTNPIRISYFDENDCCLFSIAYTYNSDKTAQSATEFDSLGNIRFTFDYASNTFTPAGIANDPATQEAVTPEAAVPAL